MTAWIRLITGYQKENERLRLKLGIVWYSSLLWMEDQVEDRDRNESNITLPRNHIKNRVYVRI